MPKQGALSKKREQLEALALTWLDFDEAEKAKIKALDYQAMKRLIEAADKWVNDALHSVIRDCCSHLVPSNDWKNMSRNPKEFNSDLDRYLSGIKLAMRLLYKIPDHRPRSPENKPRRAAELVLKYPGYSCGQLSRKYEQLYHEHITPQALERALKRFSQELQQHFIFRPIGLADRFSKCQDSEDQERREATNFESILNILVRS